MDRLLVETWPLSVQKPAAIYGRTQRGRVGTGQSCHTGQYQERKPASPQDGATTELERLIKHMNRPQEELDASGVHRRTSGTFAPGRSEQRSEERQMRGRAVAGPTDGTTPGEPDETQTQATENPYAAWLEAALPTNKPRMPHAGEEDEDEASAGPEQQQQQPPSAAQPETELDVVDAYANAPPTPQAPNEAEVLTTRQRRQMQKGPDW